MLTREKERGYHSVFVLQRVLLSVAAKKRKKNVRLAFPQKGETEPPPPIIKKYGATTTYTHHRPSNLFSPQFEISVNSLRSYYHGETC
jgi:hypothetical protein